MAGIEDHPRVASLGEPVAARAYRGRRLVVLAVLVAREARRARRARRPVGSVALRALACPATACIPPRVVAAWHDVHAGLLAGPAGPAGASGPCGRWQLRRRPAAWGPLFFCAWQVAHAARRRAARRVGVVATEALGVSGGRRRGLLHVAAPARGPRRLGLVGRWQSCTRCGRDLRRVTAAAVSRAWQVEHAGAVAAVNRCGTWQPLQGVVPRGSRDRSRPWCGSGCTSPGDAALGKAVSGSVGRGGGRERAGALAGVDLVATGAALALGIGVLEVDREVAAGAGGPRRAAARRAAGGS